MFFEDSPQCGFCEEIVTYNDLLTNSAAETLFSKVQASNHCSHALFRPVVAVLMRVCCMNLIKYENLNSIDVATNFDVHIHNIFIFV